MRTMTPVKDVLHTRTTFILQANRGTTDHLPDLSNENENSERRISGGTPADSERQLDIGIEDQLRNWDDWNVTVRC
jgi:hypothetical protein